MKLKYDGTEVKFKDSSLDIEDGKEYDVDDIKMADAISSEKLSDGETVFFARQLEAIEAESYDVLYPDLEARECFPMNSFGGEGATTLTFRSYDRVGSAQVINARATDLPKSDISGREYSIPVKSMGVAYDYDVDEIAAAKMTGMPLEARKAEAARRGYEELVNEISWNGQAGLRGFFSDENAVSRSAMSEQLNEMTPAQAAAALHSIVNNMYASTKKIHRPDFMWMPVALKMYLTSTPMSSTFPNETIMSYFLRTNEFINNMSQIKALNQLDAESNATGDFCIVIGTLNTAGKQTVRMRETMPLKFLPVQLHGLVYEIPGRGRFAGVEVTYNAAVQIWTNVWKAD